MSLPGIIIKESVDIIRNDVNEGQGILVIGHAGFPADPEKVYTFYNLEDAKIQLQDTIKEKLKDQTKEVLEGENLEAFNNLLKVIGDIFREGEVTDPNTLGLNKIQFINIGSTPQSTNQELSKALNKSEALYDVEIEVYPGLSDISSLNMVKGHLETLEKQGKYRIAIATTPKKAPVGDMVKLTKISEGNNYVNSGRIVLHVDPGMVGALAAKVACTHYYQDPAYGPYRSIKTDRLVKYNHSELANLVDAGLVVDWEVITPGGTRLVEPVYTRATNYKVNDTAADAYLHQRLNADHHLKITDSIAQSYIKQNNTETARQAIEHKCRSYLEEEVKMERLNDFTYDVYPNRNNPYALIVKMSLKPIKSIHSIEINREING